MTAIDGNACCKISPTQYDSESYKDENLLFLLVLVCVHVLCEAHARSRVYNAACDHAGGKNHANDSLVMPSEMLALGVKQNIWDAVMTALPRDP